MNPSDTNPSIIQNKDPIVTSLQDIAKNLHLLNQTMEAIGRILQEMQTSSR